MLRGLGDAALASPPDEPLVAGLFQQGWYIVLPGGRGGMEFVVYRPPAIGPDGIEQLRNLTFDRFVQTIPEGGAP
jgi:hypothetical protein